MSENLIQTLELVAWDLDPNPHRPARDFSVPLPGNIPSPRTTTSLESLDWRQEFSEILNRPDLHQEFTGLEWSLATVDLRSLQAFQRRLHFDAAHPSATIIPDNLHHLAFPPPRPTTHTRPAPWVIQSENPDLTLRPSASGWQLYGGSPFIEVALLQDRAFLRDGYHRAYALLRAGIYAVPAVAIRAHTLAEIYPPTPNFFPESTVFRARPPMVTDFLDPALTVTYPTPRTLKTIRIHVQETFEPAIRS